MKTMIILLALACAGCDMSSNPSNIEPISYHIDAETGCHYISNRRKETALTPRMGADGKQICRARP